jgi:methylase of polypeptide subunit release factors
MTEQETPTAIAAHLARYLPRSARDVLDPCTGNGALIAPILRRLPSATITALDIRPGALKEAKCLCVSRFSEMGLPASQEA